jgi:hypothetical protein
MNPGRYRDAIPSQKFMSGELKVGQEGANPFHHLILGFLAVSRFFHLDTARSFRHKPVCSPEAGKKSAISSERNSGSGRRRREPLPLTMPSFRAPHGE